MIHLALKTEYSFKQSFLHLKDIHKYVVGGYVGIADINNTYGHIPLMRESEKHGFTPIFGVRLFVLPDDSEQRTANRPWIFIARNSEGLKELYKLVETAYDQFYYIAKLNYTNVYNISDNICIISPQLGIPAADYHPVGPGYDKCDTDDAIAIDNNFYPDRDGKEVYELLAGSRKMGTGYSHNFSDQTYPMHILTEKQHLLYSNCPRAIQNTYRLARNCDATIPKADMVRWSGDNDILRICSEEAAKRKLNTPVYWDRLNYEVNLIKDKGYIDYFMITADMIKYAKKSMLVGPSRGSSAGSLVCFLLGITEVDPIEHDLIFERFIDINRFDLPDIDIDFPDTKRENVIKYLKHKYGREKVMCLANINRLKAKSAIGEFAKGLGIPPYETDGVKGAIIERSSGDARAAMCISDTFETTEPGKDFIARYPKMALVERIEDHASHAGKHAAGILVATLPLCTYGSLNNRDEVIMMDKKDAEFIGLLKVDCLGLRTLSILEGVCDQIGIPYKALYSLPLDDAPTYKLFNDIRLSGVFQFEGQALQIIVKQMGVKDFNDISAITALARPGALNSGGTARYIKYSRGDDEPVYYSEVHKEITGKTYGIVVYQEQMMEIARRIGNLTWADTSELRRAASKSLGDEFFAKYEDMFTEGALSNGHTEDEATALWRDISSSGSWSFNKAHAVSYGLVSYWTAYCKANFPMEFAVASLNNAASVDNAKKLLRDLVRNENMEYIPVDPDKSEPGWSTHDGRLVGGLLNIKGVGKVKANQIIKARNGKGTIGPALFKSLLKPETDFDVIFPARHYWGNLYDDPISAGMTETPIKISEIDGEGEYCFIGCLVDRNLRDLNEHIFLSKRNGEVIEDHSLYLNFKVEDDWDMISCRITRYHYERMGRTVAEEGRIGKDWYLIKGKIKGDYRMVTVSEIVNLNKYFKVDIK